MSFRVSCLGGRNEYTAQKRLERGEHSLCPSFDGLFVWLLFHSEEDVSWDEKQREVVQQTQIWRGHGI